MLSALNIDRIPLLHMPAQCFAEYQLRARQIAAGQSVATAAYRDGGPWDIPVKREYPPGGYEATVANCSGGSDAIFTRGMRGLLRLDGVLTPPGIPALLPRLAHHASGGRARVRLAVCFQQCEAPSRAFPRGAL